MLARLREIKDWCLLFLSVIAIAKLCNFGFGDVRKHVNELSMSMASLIWISWVVVSKVNAFLAASVILGIMLALTLYWFRRGERADKGNQPSDGLGNPPKVFHRETSGDRFIRNTGLDLESFYESTAWKKEFDALRGDFNVVIRSVENLIDAIHSAFPPSLSVPVTNDLTTSANTPAVSHIQGTGGQKKRKKQRGGAGSGQSNETSGGSADAPIIVDEEMTERTPLTMEDLQQFVGKGLDHLVQASRGKLAAIREAARKPYYLLAEEKTLAVSSLAKLYAKWKSEAGRPENDFDGEDIGQLTPEEAEFPRRTISEIMRIRKTRKYIERQKARGNPVTVCEGCQKVVGGNHACWVSRWTQKDSTGKPLRTIISQEGKGALRISQRKVVDPSQADQQLLKAQRLATCAREAAEMRRAASETGERPRVEGNQAQPTAGPTPSSEVPNVTVVEVDDLDVDFLEEEGSFQ